MDSTSEPRRQARLRQRLRDETQRAILSAAEETFGAEGLGAARMEAIAARAGVAVGTLYNYFEDRGALLTALLEARRAEVLARVDRALSASRGRPFTDQLATFLHALLDHVEAHRRFFAVALQDEATPGRLHSKHMVVELRKRAEKLVARGVEAGALRDVGPLPVLLLGMVRGVLLHSLETDRARPLPEHVPCIVSVFLEGAGEKRR
jgi:AcrR family transcriptional regulator